jgi:hypothetical protein
MKGIASMSGWGHFRRRLTVLRPLNTQTGGATRHQDGRCRGLLQFLAPRRLAEGCRIRTYFAKIIDLSAGAVAETADDLAGACLLA